MNKRVIRIVSIFAVVCFCLLALVSCGSEKGKPTAYKDAEDAALYDDAVDWAEIKIFNAIIDVYAETLDPTASKDEIVKLKEDLGTYILDNTEKEKASYEDTIVKINSLLNDSQKQQLKNKVKEIIETYCNYGVIAGSDDDEKINRNYKVDLIKADKNRFVAMLDEANDFRALSTTELANDRKEMVAAFATKSGGCIFGATTSANKDAEKYYELYKTTNETNIYKILVGFMISVEVRQLEQEPISFQLRVNEGAGAFFSDFFGNFFDNFLVFPVGIILWFTSSIAGGWYIIGLFVTTLLIRTAGWPIYAKTNDMSLKMQVIQPEMQKLEEKYANRQDPDSQRMKQAELAQIYKKNKIGLGGCFLPFLQFPIFMAVYGAVRRFPYTVATPGSQFFGAEWMDWANTTLFGGSMKSNLFFLPFDLFSDYTQGQEPWQLIGIIVLVVLVCGTQFLSQFLSERRQKTNFDRQQEDIPEYRRKAYKQQKNQSQNMMKYVMYMMIFMMGSFVFTSKAGLGIYWLIGNAYSILQMFINNELGQRKLKKLKEASDNNKYSVIPNRNNKKK